MIARRSGGIEGPSGSTARRAARLTPARMSGIALFGGSPSRTPAPPAGPLGPGGPAGDGGGVPPAGAVGGGPVVDPPSPPPPSLSETRIVGTDKMPWLSRIGSTMFATAVPSASQITPSTTEDRNSFSFLFLREASTRVSKSCSSPLMTSRPSVMLIAISSITGIAVACLSSTTSFFSAAVSSRTGVEPPSGGTPPQVRRCWATACSEEKALPPLPAVAPQAGQA